MAVDVQNAEILKKIAELTSIPFPGIFTALEQSYKPVLIVNPDPLIQSKANDLSDASSTTIVTTHATKDTYLIGCSLSIAKSVASTSLFTDIVGTPFGDAARSLLRIRYEPITAGQFNDTIFFPKPIKLARNSVLGITNSTAIASIDTTGIVYFYEVDVA